MSPEIEAALVAVAEPATTSEQLLALIASPVGTNLIVQWAVHHRTDVPEVERAAWARIAADTDLEDLCLAAGPIISEEGLGKEAWAAVDALAWGRNGPDAGWDDGVRAALDRYRHADVAAQDSAARSPICVDSYDEAEWIAADTGIDFEICRLVIEGQMRYFEVIGLVPPSERSEQ